MLPQIHKYKYKNTKIHKHKQLFAVVPLRSWSWYCPYSCLSNQLPQIHKYTNVTRAHRLDVVNLFQRLYCCMYTNTTSPSLLSLFCGRFLSAFSTAKKWDHSLDNLNYIITHLLLFANFVFMTTTTTVTTKMMIRVILSVQSLSTYLGFCPSPCCNPATAN